ncbi:Guanine nucleotide exchange factor for Cdc42p [Marasmius tenuissimus]|uniref:Guanine nucleotide exchange factor for Cdc42p n=1 Tax=Marasmius tenuissimus TaxID=585030 RepID=A0ABR2ZG28_9AGAR
MASIARLARRKITIVPGARIDIPVVNNDLLNQTALYQECYHLRARLIRLRGFNHYFSLATAFTGDQSTDPVTQLWDLFSYGVPLCYIFDLLPEEMGFRKINNSALEQQVYEANPDRPRKRAIALFVMKLKKVADRIPGVEQFMVTELWDRYSKDGLVKVVKTVKAILDHVPEDVWEDAPPDTSYMTSDDSRDSFATYSPGVISPNTRENTEFKSLEESLKLTFADRSILRDFLTKKGRPAQRWLDHMQQLVDYPHLSPELRPAIFTAMLHLSKNSGLHPTCLAIQNVRKIGKHPIAAGGFGDVWKGTIGDSSEPVCLKVMRRYLDSDLEKLSTVRSWSAVRLFTTDTPLFW